MPLRVTDSHLRFQDPQELILHIVSTESDSGDHGRQLRRFELLADIIDQVDQILFVIGDQLFGKAVFVALEPDKAGDLVTLPLIAGNDLGNVVQGLAHALDHQLVFQ